MFVRTEVMAASIDKHFNRQIIIANEVVEF